MEQWKRIQDFDRYEVSTLGRIRRDGELRATPANKYRRGEVSVRLWKDNKQTIRFVHRLVATAFIPNPLGKSQVDHIDRNPANNRVENLRWATSSENHLNARVRNKHGLPKGVLRHHAGKYRAVGHKNGESFWLGLFETPALAKLAVDSFYKEHFGDFYLP